MKKPIVFARMNQDDVDLIKRVCEMRGEDLSNFVRRAIKLELARLSYLSEDEKKALGLRPFISSSDSDQSKHHIYTPEGVIKNV